MHFCKSWDFLKIFSRRNCLECDSTGLNQLAWIIQKFPYSIILYWRWLLKKNSSESQNCNHYSVFLFTWRQTTAKPNNILHDHKSLKGLICVWCVYLCLSMSQPVWMFLSFIHWNLLYLLSRFNSFKGSQNWIWYIVNFQLQSDSRVRIVS